MVTLRSRLARIEEREGMGEKRYTHTVLASAGGQSRQEVAQEVERVCRQHGIHDSVGSMLIILRPVKLPSPDGPVYADMPIKVSSIDGMWLP